jgi:hypothetical protein
MRLNFTSPAAWAGALAAMLLGANAGAAQLTLLGPCLVTDLSANGSVAVGNTSDGNYETFRWTQATGECLLAARRSARSV